VPLDAGDLPVPITRSTRQEQLPPSSFDPDLLEPVLSFLTFFCSESQWTPTLEDFLTGIVFFIPDLQGPELHIANQLSSLLVVPATARCSFSREYMGSQIIPSPQSSFLPFSRVDISTFPDCFFLTPQ